MANESGVYGQLGSVFGYLGTGYTNDLDRTIAIGVGVQGSAELAFKVAAITVSRAGANPPRSEEV